MQVNCKGFFYCLFGQFQVVIFLVASVGPLAASSQKDKLNLAIVFYANC